MRILKALYLALGGGLLVFVFGQVDLGEVAEQIRRIGPVGLAVLFVTYFTCFAIGTVIWQMALVEVPLTWRWAYRAWKLRMASEVLNTVIPAAGFGGEPMKAEMLKKLYGIGYREGLASIILGKTVSLLGLVLFLAVGFVLLWRNETLGGAYAAAAAVGVGGFSLSILLFFAVQRWKVTSLTGTWLARLRFARGLDAVLHHISDMDGRLVRFYTRHGWRFVGALLLGFIDWIVGAAEVYFALFYLGHPVSMADAWIIEAGVQLVRNATFVIPAGLGTQEGGFLVICGALTGVPTLGVSLALVRRLRELVWLLWGGAIGVFLLRLPLMGTIKGDSGP
ncbi:MAG: flippase-like domain-containing protein [Alphaproteobacteria bacterium]|nr:flippase-like domain-containing protein [Alphaproteobacteria bacterium]MBF0128483.1 flippase-like domain-containing protein [Alphaproteobacteria bacterium]